MHQQEVTHNHDPSVHQYTHAGRQEDNRKITQKRNQAQYFIKAKYLQKVQSFLTDFQAKYERVSDDPQV
jgi:tryptophanyl-tRNA synthetase